MMSLIASVQEKSQFVSSLVLLVTVVGCKQAPKLKVDSDIPARIELSGRSVCDSTPCEVRGAHYVNGYGMCIGGAQSPLEAFSLSPNGGFRQQKVVAATCGEVINVRFDMKSGSLVNVAAVDLKSDGAGSKSVEERLSELEVLKKKKLITEDEYKAKRKEILDSLK